MPRAGGVEGAGRGMQAITRLDPIQPKRCSPHAKGAKLAKKG
jgi:hypothetical protein